MSLRPRTLKKEVRALLGTKIRAAELDQRGHPGEDPKKN